MKQECFLRFVRGIGDRDGRVAAAQGLRRVHHRPDKGGQLRAQTDAVGQVVARKAGRGLEEIRSVLRALCGRERVLPVVGQDDGSLTEFGQLSDRFPALAGQAVCLIDENGAVGHGAEASEIHAFIIEIDTLQDLIQTLEFGRLRPDMQDTDTFLLGQVHGGIVEKQRLAGAGQPGKSAHGKMTFLIAEGQIARQLVLNVALLIGQEIVPAQKAVGVSEGRDEILILAEELLNLSVIERRLFRQKAGQLRKIGLKQVSRIGQAYEPAGIADIGKIPDGPPDGGEIVAVLDQLPQDRFIGGMTALQFDVDDALRTDAQQIKFLAQLRHDEGIIERVTGCLGRNCDKCVAKCPEPVGLPALDLQ